MKSMTRKDMSEAKEARSEKDKKKRSSANYIE